MKSTAIILAAMMMAGCNSLRVAQVNHFSDNDANVTTVQFCRAKNNHKVKYTAPNGNELSAETKLAVKVKLPDGESFTAWKTLNPPQLTSGTAYKTDDGEYMFWAHGFSCIVFVYDEEVKDWAFLFEGILTKQ